MSSTQMPPPVYTAPKGVFDLGHSRHLSVILQAIAHNSHITDHFFGKEHKPKHCTSEGCVACCFTEALKQLISTEEKGGLTPVTLLQASWQFSTVSWPLLTSPMKTATKPIVRHLLGLVSRMLTSISNISSMNCTRSVAWMPPAERIIARVLPTRRSLGVYVAR